MWFNRPSSILLTAALMDFFVGDPWGWPHPVQFMGKAISLYRDTVLAAYLSPRVMKLAGIGLAALVVGGCGGLTWLVIYGLGHGAGQFSAGLQWLVEVVLLSSCFAGRSLRRAAEEVLSPLANLGAELGRDKPTHLQSEAQIKSSLEGNSSPPSESLRLARTQLAMYVGRDTENLTVADIYRAVLETVSENAIDGVLAPLFYAILGGLLGAAAPVAIAYKAASTLDSMVGYREAPYTHLGWASARLEDGLTWLPCRLSVLTIALLSGKPRHVLHLCQRDAVADPSPNAGWSECAYAAALGVQLGGPNIYQGKLKVKPYLGNATKPITATVIRQALSLTRLSFLIGLATGTGLLTLICIASTASN